MQYAKPVTLNVEECDRLSFLPYLFGNDFLYAEAYVYALAQKMMPEYQGGFWHFIRLPDGGGYMMPDGDRFHLVNGENWFDRTVSADAAGIILTSLVINRQLWLYHDSGDVGLTQLYRRCGSRQNGIAWCCSASSRKWQVNGGRRSGMSVRSQALVPLSTEQQAAWRAVAETEKRRHQGNTLAEYPYAGAFFRCLNGSRRISLSDLRFFMPSLTAEELHGNRLQWLYAIDVLIETQGEVCLLPLPGDAAERLFPSVRFRVRERSRHKSALVMQKYSRQQAREAEQKARAYQALVAQAEIELAFHSPETVGSWHARWSDRVAEHDLETLFWQWGERFPSLAGMERWQWQDMPFWQVIAEASLAAREAGHAVREMERWMVPNKLREAA